MLTPFSVWNQPVKKNALFLKNFGMEMQVKSHSFNNERSKNELASHDKNKERNLTMKEFCQKNKDKK
jgi:hypothetical protein